MSVSLFKAFVQGMTDYIVKHNANYALVETNLNYLLGMVTGQAGGDISVPPGLKEVFDRQGLIGIGSYGFNAGTLTGPSYNLTVAAGAYWSGATGNFRSRATPTSISMSGQATGTYYVYLDASGNPVVGISALADTVWQFAWNSSTHVVSAKALFAGVSILFDGDDYADQLTSTARNKSFTKVADRLEAIEQLLAEMSGFYAEDPDNHAGLDFYYLAGKVRNDSVIYDTVAGHVTLADDDTNYVEVDPADGTVSANGTGFTSGQIALFQVVTASGAITNVTDVRTWALAGTGGCGGGGHTQNTDIGTTSPAFTLNNDATGAPTQDCKLEVKRADETNVALKWNETENKWQYTNDGANWYNLGDITVALGAQELTKYVPVDDPQEVWTETNRGASIDWEDLDLSSFISAMQGCSAVVLRVFFWDSAPGPGVNVQFRKKDAPALPTLAYSAWKDEYDPRTLIVPVDADLVCQFFVNASGVDTANLRVFLLGYFEKVIGVGTQDRTFTPLPITVAASSNAAVNQASFMNRGLVHYLKVAETGGLVFGTYAIEIFARDTFQDEDLLYKAVGIRP
ncbi:MAG: hypothetical protein KJ822_06055, partial [Proteobacteria bacterium]|nr:hypothetical protein [Pseudomonadota bacterium]